jgi:hypothetical protein
MVDSTLTPEPDARPAAGIPEDAELHGPIGELIANDERVELTDGERFKTTSKLVEILVNNRAVEVPGHKVTGAQIKQAAEVPADFKLFGPDGEEIGDNDTIKVKHDERFTAISGQDVS